MSAKWVLSKITAAKLPQNSRCLQFLSFHLESTIHTGSKISLSYSFPTEFNIYAIVQLFISSLCYIFFLFCFTLLCPPPASLCSCDSGALSVSAALTSGIWAVISLLSGGFDGRGDKAGWGFIDQMQLTIMDSFDRGPVVQLRPASANLMLHITHPHPITFLKHSPHISPTLPPLSQAVLHSTLFWVTTSDTVSKDWSQMLFLFCFVFAQLCTLLNLCRIYCFQGCYVVLFKVRRTNLSVQVSVFLSICLL